MPNDLVYKKLHNTCPFLSVAVVFGMLGIAGCLSSPAYEGPPSDHFDGKVFYNRIPSERGFWDFLKLSLGFYFAREPWPDWIDSSPKEVPKLRWKDKEIYATFINHSTVILQVGGVNIITDPIYSKRASSLAWVGPERVRDPGVRFIDLPPIDVILVSHNHYDHLDIETLRLLQSQNSDNQSPLILSGLGNGKLYEMNEIKNYRDLDWGQSVRFGNLEFIFTECRHLSGRGITDHRGTLWGSFVIKTRFGSIYFAGDTGYGPHFKETRKKFGRFIMSFIPIGAYEPRWFMHPFHLNPLEAVQAHIDLGSERSIGIHFGTFHLTYEGINKPVQDLEKALGAKQISKEEFWVLDFGETKKLVF